MDFALGKRNGPDLVMYLALAMGTKRECGLLDINFIIFPWKALMLS